MKRCILITLGLLVVSLGRPSTEVVARTPTKHVHVLTNATWKYSAIEEPDWSTVAFDDSGWLNVVAPSAGQCSPDIARWGAVDESPLPGSDARPIWAQNPQSFQTIFIRKTFTLERATIGTIRAAADDELDLYVNGILVGRESNGQAGPILRASISLRGGANVIAMKAVDSVGGCQAAIADALLFDPSCAGTPATILGTADRDVLRGGPGRDVIVAFGGNDSISGGGGTDLICAGAGPDRISGGAGDDTVFAQQGSDTAAGNSGDDRLHGGRSADALRGGAGRDTVIGGPGADSISGNRDRDVLAGGPGDDIYVGGIGSDTASFASSGAGVRVNLSRRVARGEGVDILSSVESLHGTRFSDRLIGGSGADALLGVQGDDVLIGAGGRDRLTGGPGRDRCAGEVLVGCELTVASRGSGPGRCGTTAGRRHRAQASREAGTPKRRRARRRRNCSAGRARAGGRSGAPRRRA